MLKNYTDVRGWLEGFIPYTYSKKNLGLERITYLLGLLGNPEKKFKSILIGGTSGKGSTAYYLARALAVSNFQFPISNFQSNTKYKILNTKYPKIGLHVSPHLTYIGERMQIFQISNFKFQISNGEIPVKRLVGLINEIKPVVEAIMRKQPHLTPSYFEILAAASFLYFAQEKVDMAVVEVGLGGRLDATNVLNQDLSVITNVGLDHTDILGKTIEEIAREKAGIIKSIKYQVSSIKEKQKDGVAVVMGASGKALEVIEKVAKEKNASLITISTLKTSDRQYYDLLRNIKDQIDLELGKKVYITNECFFLVNLALNQLGIRLSENKQRKVFSAHFEGRFEEIDDGVLVDGAHNRDKARVLINWVKKIQRLTTKDKRLKSVILVCAFKKGKDWKGILRLLLKEHDVDRVYATQFNAVTDTGFFAAVEPDEIEEFLISNFPPSSRLRRASQFQISKVKTFKNSQEAVWEAVREQGPTLPENPQSRSLIIITGSLYLAGEARTIWHLPAY